MGGIYAANRPSVYVVPVFGQYYEELLIQNCLSIYNSLLPLSALKMIEIPEPPQHDFKYDNELGMWGWIPKEVVQPPLQKSTPNEEITNLPSVSTDDFQKSNP